MTTEVKAPFTWREAGEGEPLLLVHGLMGEGENWERVLEPLGHSTRALALEMPVLELKAADLSITGLAGYAQRFLDLVGVRRTVIAGNSLGGQIAVEMALAKPDLVSGLILTGSSGLFERSFSRPPLRPSRAFVRQKMEEIFFDHSIITPEWVEASWRMVNNRSYALRLLRLARAARKHDVEPRLRALRVPTLIIWGKDDQITPPHVAKRFHDMIPGSRLVFLDRCGHVPMIDRPVAFSEAIGSWLQETRTFREPVTEVA